MSHKCDYSICSFISSYQPKTKKDTEIPITSQRLTFKKKQAHASQMLVRQFRNKTLSKINSLTLNPSQPEEKICCYATVFYSLHYTTQLFLGY